MESVKNDHLYLMLQNMNLYLFLPVLLEPLLHNSLLVLLQTRSITQSSGP